MARKPIPGKAMHIPIELIRLDGQTQVRVRLDDEAVASYAEQMQQNEKFPPVVVYHEKGQGYWLADGFHRIRAATSLSKKTVPAQVMQGTREDARWYACGANRKNGIRMTRADKENAVKVALELKPRASARDIAEHIGVSHEYVARLRRGDHPSTVNVDSAPDRVIAKDGRSLPAHPIIPQPVTPFLINPNGPPPVTMPVHRNASRDLDDSPPPVTVSDGPPPAVSVLAAPDCEHGRDRVNQPIPTARIAADFARDEELRELAQQLTRVKSRVLDLANLYETIMLDLTPSAFAVDIDNARRQIESCRPFAVCPYCGGDPGLSKCRACHVRGWVNEITYHNAPKRK